MNEIIVNENDFSLLSLVPAVLRARDYRLYTNNGKRMVDLWLNGGSAVLGHTPPSFLKEIKNTASRGLYAPFPHFLEKRYIKALSGIFPGRNFRLYAAPPPELENLILQGKAAIWRPYEQNNNEVLVLVVPGIQGWRAVGKLWLPLGLCVLAIDPDFEKNTKLPPGDFLPPVLLAAAARGLYDLIAAEPLRSKPNFPKIAKALKKNKGSEFWQQQGIYLVPRNTQTSEEWALLFKQFLEAGFLLPPVPSQPLVLPGILSPGEEAKLAAIL